MQLSEMNRSLRVNILAKYSVLDVCQALYLVII